jgi:hypothetical protein
MEKTDVPHDIEQRLYQNSEAKGSMRRQAKVSLNAT